MTESQKNVTGTVRLKLYKGNIMVAGRKSPVSLYNPAIATMEADPTQAYNQDDATGFIRLNALRLKVAAQVHEKGKDAGHNLSFRMGRMRVQQMKLAFSFALAVVASLACARGAPHSPDQVQIAGKEYVRLTDWARANDLEVHWLKTDETLQLTGRSARLFLNVDSCEARINGITVWLLSPSPIATGRSISRSRMCSPP